MTRTTGLSEEEKIDSILQTICDKINNINTVSRNTDMEMLVKLNKLKKLSESLNKQCTLCITKIEYQICNKEEK